MKKIVSSALALVILASAGAASAQPRRDDHRGPEHRADRRDDRRQDQFERQADRRYKAGRYKAPKGHKAHRWAKGERLPPAYRGRNYVVDYRQYNLVPPPRGYQYNRVDNDVVLTAIATGVIGSVILNLFQ